MAPPAVRLTDGPVAGALKRHALLTAEADHGVERGAGALQPAVGQDAGGAAVDFWKKRIASLLGS